MKGSVLMVIVAVIFILKPAHAYDIDVHSCKECLSSSNFFCYTQNGVGSCHKRLPDFEYCPYFKDKIKDCKDLVENTTPTPTTKPTPICNCILENEKIQTLENNYSKQSLEIITLENDNKVYQDANDILETKNKACRNAWTDGNFTALLIIIALFLILMIVMGAIVFHFYKKVDKLQKNSRKLIPSCVQNPNFIENMELDEILPSGISSTTPNNSI